MRKVKKKKIDLRVRLTRSLLKDALVQLMQKQHISKISVRALCELAGINRSTFYTHYTDHFDLLNKVEQEVLDNLKSYLEKQVLKHNRPISLQVLTNILDYFKENVELFKALLSENCDLAFQKDILELSLVVSQISQSLSRKTQEYTNTFALNGAISILQKWAQGGMYESSAQMAEFIIQVLYYGISSLNEKTLSDNLR